QRGARVITAPSTNIRREILTRGILATAGCLGLSRVFGLARELLVAAKFGPTDATDAAYVAIAFLTTGTTVLSLTLPNAIAQTFYARDVGPVERRRQLWGFLGVWTIVLVASTALIALFPGPLLSLLVQRGTSEFRSLTAEALRLAAVGLVFQGLFLTLAALGNAEGWHA